MKDNLGINERDIKLAVKRLADDLEKHLEKMSHEKNKEELKELCTSARMIANSLWDLGEEYIEQLKSRTIVYEYLKKHQQEQNSQADYPR